MRKWFEIGGLVAAVVLVAFGIATLVLGVNGRDTVSSSLKQEYITGSPDMTPAAIAPEVKAIGLAQQQIAAAQVKARIPESQRTTFTQATAPTCSVAGTLVSDGDTARCFAQYMRIHALGATNGLVYSQMGRFVAAPGTPVKYTDFAGGTSDPTKALVDPKTKQPTSNGRRDLWVTETALTTALNTSYMATRLSMFALVVGVALLLSGLGFGILAIGGALRSQESPLERFRKHPAQKGAKAVPTV